MSPQCWFSAPRNQETAQGEGDRREKQGQDSALGQVQVNRQRRRKWQTASGWGREESVQTWMERPAASGAAGRWSNVGTKGDLRG